MSLFEKIAAVTRTAPPPDREAPVPHGVNHFVNGHLLDPPWPAGCEEALLGMGCFWGAERKFWRLGESVYVTAVGYAGGATRNPSYEDVCTGRTGHAEVVRVVYHPAFLPFDQLLGVFWESHDPTQGMRQGNDVGTQYRSVIYVTTDQQLQAAHAMRDLYQKALTQAGRGVITTEIALAPTFFYAEAYHQQYLAKNPDGYCGLGGTGVTCPRGDPAG